METSNPRPPLEPRPPSAGQPATPRPPLNRVDSRPLIQQQQPRLGPPITPPQPQPQQHPQQQRPQFLPGGPVTAPPQLGPRPGTPGPVRAPIPGSLPQQPLAPRPQTPITRPSGPQSFAPQQASRPLGPPPPGQYLQRAPPPNNLQFGPRQPPQLGVPSTPEGPKPQPFQPPNGLNRSAVPPPGLPNRPPPASSSPSAQLSRQSSQASLQGSDISGPNQVKQGTLENLGSSLDKQNVLHPENGVDMPGATKTRSYSIAAPPGAPSPLKMEADRRTSVSAIGGRIEEIGSRGPTLGLIQEAKSDVSLKTGSSALKGSRESVRSDVSNESVRESVDHRPDSRLSGSKMSESFIGNFNSTPKKKADDDDDVVLQNQKGPIKQFNLPSEIKADTFDRSPSLSRSDSSPEPKQVAKPKVEPVLGGPKSLIGAIGANTPETPTTLPLKASETKVTPIKEVKTPPAKISSVAPSHSDIKSPIHTDKKPPPFSSPIPPNDARKSARNARSTPKSRPKDGDNDSGVDESTQGNDNGSPGSPNKKSPSKIPAVKQSNGLQKPSLSRSSSKSATAKTPENPPTPEKKKVPMNKVQVGNAPSPNIKAVKSKIGSLENTTYKPGGGKVKIENRKLDFNKATPKIAAKNETYTPGGGAKKITQTKLQWNAKSKIGSLDNTSYKPGGGDKKIETVKLEFKDKAKPKVASTVNITHKPGGGAIKIENQKLEFKAQSKVGSLDNVKYKPGGGEVKIFDDKEYIKQMSGQTTTGSVCQSGQESPIPPASGAPKSDENLNQQPC